MFYISWVNEISIRTLNQETSKVLARVKSGEEITVTERGAAIARIVPTPAGPLDELVAAGRVRPATMRGPAPRPTTAAGDGPDAGALVRGMRDEERF